MEEKKDQLSIDAWNDSFHTFGKGYIFDKRAEKFSKYVNLLKVFGIVAPVAVGATAIGYGFNSTILKYMVVFAIPISIIQLMFSVLAVIFRWDEQLAYSYEASQDYNNLSSSFKKLAKFPPTEIAEFENRLELLKAKYQARSEQDAKHSVKEWELRKGMRYALREFQRKCVACNNVPTSMESTDCNVCGKFESEFRKGAKEWMKKFIV
jgi:mobilome CxxCx(11)CxxC protein